MSSVLYAEHDSLKRMQQAFSKIPTQVNRFWVAFSGGLDSHILLHATQHLLPHWPLTAIHVNHGLHTEASQWENHCQVVCNSLQIPLVVYSVSEKLYQYRKLGYSPEDAARKARYTALTQRLSEADCLLTAHHMEDQAETLLLRLMRGAGIRGLGSMRLLSRSGDAYHLRPLLHWNYEERIAYANQHQLQWVEDPSNQNQHFRRNFVRHTVLPIFKQRWPQASQALDRAARHCAEASQLSEEVAITDLDSCQIATDKLSIQALLALSLLRRRNALRYWLQGVLSKPPNTVQFERIEKMLYTTPGANPVFYFQAVGIKRYRDHLYLLSNKANIHGRTHPIKWHTANPLDLSDWGTLTAIPCYGKGIRTNLIEGALEVRFRRGGERFHVKGRLGSHPLKKLFQEWSIPPWERYQWPLIYQKDQLIAVPGYAVSEKSAARPGESGLCIQIARSTKKAS